jgi:hypothetical protein
VSRVARAHSLLEHGDSGPHRDRVICPVLVLVDDAALVQTLSHQDFSRNPVHSLIDSVREQRREMISRPNVMSQCSLISSETSTDEIYALNLMNDINKMKIHAH